MNKKLILIVIAAVGLIYFVPKLFYPEEQRVLKVLNQAAELASIPAEEHPIEGLSKAKKLAKLCTENIDLFITFSSERIHKVKSRADLEKHVLASRRYLKNVKVKLYDEKVKVNDKIATVHLTIKVTGQDLNLKDKFVDATELIIGLKKVDGDWLVNKVENVEVVEAL